MLARHKAAHAHSSRVAPACASLQLLKIEAKEDTMSQILILCHSSPKLSGSWFGAQQEFELWYHWWLWCVCVDREVPSAWRITCLLGQKKANLSYLLLQQSLALGFHTFSIIGTENILALCTLVANVVLILCEGERTYFWQALLIMSHFLAQSPEV